MKGVLYGITVAALIGLWQVAPAPWSIIGLAGYGWIGWVFADYYDNK